MGGVSNKTTSLITRVLDLTYFSRSQRFENNYEVGVFCYYLTYVHVHVECSNFAWMIWANSTFTPNFGLIGFQVWPWGLAAILEKQLSLELIPGSSPNFYHSLYSGMAWNRFFKPWSNFVSWAGGVHLYSTFRNWGAIFVNITDFWSFVILLHFNVNKMNPRVI
jgi:hypothetical protein